MSWILDEPANDDHELDPHERELIEASGFDPDDAEDVHLFCLIERETEEIEDAKWERLRTLEE